MATITIRVPQSVIDDIDYIKENSEFKPSRNAVIETLLIEAVNERFKSKK